MPKINLEEKLIIEQRSRTNVRHRADAIKPYRCKNLIAVMERPKHIKNIGTVIRKCECF